MHAPFEMRSDQRMAGLLVVFECVAILRLLTAADVAAYQTES
jgi:hypothetical protein